MFPHLKLTYFDIRGRAEATRLALYIADIPFEDERLDREQFASIKPSLPMNQLPVLTVDKNKVIAQSYAHLRYAGTLAGLYPDTPLQALLVDQVIFSVQDVLDSLRPSMHETDAAKKKTMRQTLSNDTLPRLLSCLDKILTKYGGKYAVGDALTVADLSVYVMAAYFKSGTLDDVPVNLVDCHHSVAAVVCKVAEHPRVMQWESLHRK